MSDKEADSNEPGEFTRLFGGVSPATPPPSQTSEMPAADKSDLPGDATVIRPLSKLEEFRAKALRPPPQPQRPDRLGRPTPPEPVADPGGLTRTFKTTPERAPAVAPKQEPPDKARDAAPQPGEFTQLFQVPSKTQPAPAPIVRPAKPAAAPPPVSPPSSAVHDSDFTRYFKAPQMPAGRDVNWKAVEAQPLAPPSPKAPGEFTHLFGRPTGATPPSGGGPTQPPVKLVDRLATSQAPVDDFARVVGQRPDAAKPSAAPAGAANASAAPGSQADASSASSSASQHKALLVLLGTVAFIVFLSAIAVYFFVLRK